MKKRLQLHRETLVKLDSRDAIRVLAGVRLVHETFDSGETYCWCSQGCPPGSAGCSEPVETAGCNVY